MKSLKRLRRRRTESGTAALELAAFMLFAIPLLTAPFLIAIYFWHYTAAQKAAQGAAQYLATVSAREMKSAALAGYANTIIKQIADDGTSDLIPNSHYIVDIDCDMATGSSGSDWVNCGDGPPSQVRVIVRMRLMFTRFGDVDTSENGLPIRAEARMRYVGN
jgi:Flp pilus assembly protein TadG